MKQIHEVMLEVIDLHRPDTAFEDATVCVECLTIFPCKTRQLMREGTAIVRRI